MKNIILISCALQKPSVMRLRLFLIFIFSLFLISCDLLLTENPRRVTDFNFGWKFILEDLPWAERPDFDDAAWQDVRLPYDWSAEQSFTQKNAGASNAFLPGGVGWFRKTFTLPEKTRQNSTWIEFDGIYNNAEVWINGHYLGKWPYGYSSFNYDLTPYLNFGHKKNLIAVKVDHSAYIDCRWYTGSGIYRNVRLVSTGRVHIPVWGVFVTTPQISNSSATVNLQIQIQNDGNRENKVEAAISIISPDNQIVAGKKIETNIAPGSSNEVTGKLDIANPELWDTRSPAMYTAEIKLYMAKREVDSYKVTFGIRDIHFDSKTGFFLNGKNMNMKGVCLHHDAGCVGAAVPVGVWERRLKKLKEIGCNAIRTAHNPPAPEFLDLCDRMGFLVIDEAFDEWNRCKSKWITVRSAYDGPDSLTSGYPKYFSEWAEHDLKHMVLRDRNHPSVILWSIGNEIEWTFPYYRPINNAPEDKKEEVFRKLAGGKCELVDIANRLKNWVKEIDTTRLVMAGEVLPDADIITGFADAVEVMGYNYKAEDYDWTHKQNPGRIILGTENWGQYQEWKDCIDRDFVSGIFVWTGISYLGEAGPWPKKGSQASFFDFACFKTPRGHFFECLWNEDPKVYLCTNLISESEYIYNNESGVVEDRRKDRLRKWSWDHVVESWNYKEGDSVLVHAYTNCHETELFLNGQSLGRKRPDDFKDHAVKWLVRFKPGELKAKAYYENGDTVTHRIRSAGNPQRIILKADKKNILPDEYDVVHLEAFLVDKTGIPVVYDERKVHFKVEGDCRILGVDNGSEYIIQDNKSDYCFTNLGKCLLILQAGKTSGNIKISVSSTGLESSSVLIRVGK